MNNEAQAADSPPTIGTLAGMLAAELTSEERLSENTVTRSEPTSEPAAAPGLEQTAPETGVDADTSREPDSVAETPLATSAINAPAGMSEAERAVFAQLPREQQAWVTQRESQRTADYTRKTQEVAAHARAVQSERQALSGQLEQYSAFLSKVTDQSIAPPDPALQQTDPYAYQERMADFVQAKFRQEQAQVEQAKVQAQRQYIEKQQYGEFVQAETAKLVDIMPEFQDPKTGPALKKAVAEYGLSNGIPVTALERATAVEIAILTKAMRFEAAQKAKASATIVPTAAPRSSRPGPARAPGRGTSMTDAVQNLSARPTRESLAAALMAELSAE